MILDFGRQAVDDQYQDIPTLSEQELAHTFKNDKDREKQKKLQEERQQTKKYANAALTSIKRFRHPSVDEIEHEYESYREQVKRFEATLAIIACKLMDPFEKVVVNKLFDLIDESGDGKIAPEELESSF